DQVFVGGAAPEHIRIRGAGVAVTRLHEAERYARQLATRARREQEQSVVALLRPPVADLHAAERRRAVLDRLEMRNRRRGRFAGLLLRERREVLCHYRPGFNNRNPSGGSVSRSDWSWPCDGTASV